MRFIVRGSILGALLYLTVLLVAPNQAAAQASVGVFAGPTIAKLDGDEVRDDGTRTGFFVGAAVSNAFYGNLGGGLGLLYTQKGGGEGADEIALDYIAIPLFAAYMLPISETATLNVFAGPQLSILIGCEVGEEGEDCNDEVLTPENQFEATGRTWDLVLGAEGGFMLNESVGVNVGVAYEHSFSDALELFGNELDARSRAFYVFAGLSMPLGGGGM